MDHMKMWKRGMKQWQQPDRKPEQVEIDHIVAILSKAVQTIERSSRTLVEEGRRVGSGAFTYAADIAAVVAYDMSLDILDEILHRLYSAGGTGLVLEVQERLFKRLRRKKVNAAVEYCFACYNGGVRPSEMSDEERYGHAA